jgi:hypothetical protein
MSIVAVWFMTMLCWCTLRYLRCATIAAVWFMTMLCWCTHQYLRCATIAVECVNSSVVVSALVVLCMHVH